MTTETKDPNLVQFRRFLYLGDECQQFPQSVKYPFSPEIAQCIQELGNARLIEKALDEIKKAYKNDYYLEFETLIYALVALGHIKDRSLRLVFETASEICTSAEFLLTFTHLYKAASKPGHGWGRAHRRFLKEWYNGKTAKELAVEVTRVKSYHKWSHKDVLCMAHVKAENSGNAAVLKYLVKGLEVAQRESGSEVEAEPILNYLKGVCELAHTTDPETAARLIEIHDLCLEHVPPKLLKSKEVSQCIIPRISLQNLLELLPQFNKANLLIPSSPHSEAVLQRLGSEEALTNTSLGPLETFLALRRWQISNKITSGKSMVKQSNPAIENALQELHLSSFKAVKPTEKRYLVALDINLTMNHSKCTGCNALTPSHVSDVLLMALLKAEVSNVTTVVFSTGEVLPVDINHELNLTEVVELLNEISPGPAVLSAPINWALTKKMPFDTFLVFTDRLASTMDADLATVIQEYKETMHLPDTRYILSTLCDRNSSFDHEESYFLNVVGFNIKLLKVIQDFSGGVF